MYQRERNTGVKDLFSHYGEDFRVGRRILGRSLLSSSQTLPSVVAEGAARGAVGFVIGAMFGIGFASLQTVLTDIPVDNMLEVVAPSLLGAAIGAFIEFPTSIGRRARRRQAH